MLYVLLDFKVYGSYCELSMDRVVGSLRASLMTESLGGPTDRGNG